MTTKARYLTAHLLKRHITTYEDALREPKALESYQLRDGLPFDGALYVRPARNKQPDWLEFVLEGVTHKDVSMETISQSAVLFVRSSGCLFAFTFGYGRHLLKPNAHEIDFGLKAALNAVDPARLRSIDLKSFQESPLHTRRQASRSSAIDAFGVDFNRDLLRAVTGTPRDADIISRISGSDSIAINARVGFDALGGLCEHLLALYNDITYKEHFKWIDHLRLVRDPDTIDSLDQRLLTALQSSSLERIYLAPPEPIEWDRVQGFVYSTSRDKQSFPDLELDDYLSTIRGRATLSVAMLKRHAIRACDGDGETIIHWSVYDSLCFETDLGEHTYILNGKHWFQVDLDYVSEVNQRIARIRHAQIGLPRARKGEKEGPYNQRVAETSNEFILLDRMLIQGDGWNSKIEVCDLLSHSGCFVHVKKQSRSSTMSHLFAQGLVSAEAFLNDEVFRSRLAAKVVGSCPDLDRMIGQDRPNARDFEVVFALIGQANEEWPVSLPFFSKVHLSHAVSRIEAFGYRVSLCHVSDEDD